MVQLSGNSCISPDKEWYCCQVIAVYLDKKGWYSSQVTAVDLRIKDVTAVR